MPARRCASRVQLVDRKQIRGPEMVDVDPRTGKRPQDDRGEILGSSVMTGDEIADVHEGKLGPVGFRVDARNPTAATWRIGESLGGAGFADRYSGYALP